MGLDMYLTKKTYIGAEYEHRAITGTIDLYTKERPIKINFKRVSEICESVGYWRKANQIHKWFVDNVQDGEDDCKPYDVSEDKLKSLLTVVNAVLDAKNTSDEEDAIATHLPPTDGFFFGSTFIDDWYWDQIEYTKQTITEILQEIEQDKDDNMWVTYVYQSSW